MASEFSTSTASTYCSPALEDAWRRFGDYDKNANLAQKRFLRQRKWITMLGVIVTTLAVIDLMLEKSLLNPDHWFTRSVMGVLPYIGLEFDTVVNWIDRGLNVIIVIIPILISILVAGAVKFNMGINWVMLRSAAESIKREIYRYRTQVGIYDPTQPSDNGKVESRDVILARRVKQIGKRVMETQVNMSELEIYDYKKEGLPPLYGVAAGDDGFSDLTADQYVHWRIEDQFDYYRSKARRLAKELQRFQWSIYAIGGLGTLLAAIQMEIWVAITSTVVSALGSFLEFKRVETNLIGMNLAASDLYDIRAWWRALNNSAKQQHANKTTLVNSAEAVIQSENSSWLTEMREALSELYSEEEGEDDKKDDSDRTAGTTIAVLPENVNNRSQAAASASTALDSLVKGEGASWLSTMQATLAATNGKADEADAVVDIDIDAERPSDESLTVYAEAGSPSDNPVNEIGYSDEPVYEETVGDVSQKGDIEGNASHEELVYESSYEEPADEGRAYGETSYEENFYEEPAYGERSYGEDSCEESVYEQSISVVDDYGTIADDEIANEDGRTEVSFSDVVSDTDDTESVSDMESCVLDDRAIYTDENLSPDIESNDFNRSTDVINVAANVAALEGSGELSDAWLDMPTQFDEELNSFLEGDVPSSVPSSNEKGVTAPAAIPDVTPEAIPFQQALGDNPVLGDNPEDDDEEGDV